MARAEGGTHRELAALMTASHEDQNREVHTGDEYDQDYCPEGVLHLALNVIDDHVSERDHVGAEAGVSRCGISETDDRGGHTRLDRFYVRIGSEAHDRPV